MTKSSKNSKIFPHEKTKNSKGQKMSSLSGKKVQFFCPKMTFETTQGSLGAKRCCFWQVFCPKMTFETKKGSLRAKKCCFWQVNDKIKFTKQKVNDKIINKRTGSLTRGNGPLCVSASCTFPYTHYHAN